MRGEDGQRWTSVEEIAKLGLYPDSVAGSTIFLKAQFGRAVHRQAIRKWEQVLEIRSPETALGPLAFSIRRQR
jgi:hypothetical protein